MTLITHAPVACILSRKRLHFYTRDRRLLCVVNSPRALHVRLPRPLPLIRTLGDQR